MAQDVRATPYGEYEAGAEGWVVEALRVVQWADEPKWVIPAWDEQGHPALSGTFATRAEAEDAIHEELESRGWIEDRPVEQRMLDRRELARAWRL